ncbi:crotonase/enoyl-CoA hydratase family protein [Microvirga sp. 2TAF3]|uniref:crotonase/enoyl-CoA hydratase family protein n=1 Tax=Microvirga sp. 2TAF3 TaxID=3233014 RepID=UPI003F94B0D2
MHSLQTQFDGSAPLGTSRIFSPLTNAERIAVPAHVEVANTQFPNIDTMLDPETRTYWAAMRPSIRPIFTMDLLHDMKRMQSSIAQIFDRRRSDARQPIEYVVFSSRTPGIYNMGGDLAHFAERIRARDRESMQAYAYACIDVIYGNAHAFNTPVITMALVQGDALGGGFECALSFDLIVAERSAKMGLPEVLFNLFPGMGAYSFLSRRIGSVAAEKMIMSGKLYTAEELHALGVVDVLAEDGEGEMAVQEYIERNNRKHNAHNAIYRARRRVNPVTYEELRDIVDIWVDAALKLTDLDLRKMARLTTAQDRRLAAALAPYAIAAE